MKKDLLQCGERYKDLKGRDYQLITIALNSGTKEKMAVYQELFEPFAVKVCPLWEFTRNCCTEKEENSVSGEQEKNTDISCEVLEQSYAAEKEEQIEWDNREGIRKREISAEEFVKAVESGQAMRYLGKDMTKEEIGQRGLIELLDAESYREKRSLFLGLKEYLDEKLLHSIAMAMDVVLEDGSFEQQYESLLHCLCTFEHYEGGRLRS